MNGSPFKFKPGSGRALRNALGAVYDRLKLELNSMDIDDTESVLTFILSLLDQDKLAYGALSGMLYAVRRTLKDGDAQKILVNNQEISLTIPSDGGRITIYCYAPYKRSRVVVMHDGRIAVKIDYDPNPHGFLK